MSSTLIVAFRKLAPPAFLGVLPLVLIISAAMGAIHGGDLGVDFRRELFPEARLIVHGQNPFPAATADLSGGANMIFPVPAAALVAPLLPLPAGAAAIVFGVVLLVALAAALWLLGVTDWRVYGLVALWTPTISALQTENVTILLCLFVALAWRFRERAVWCGVVGGVAIALKLFLWPIVVWLIATRRWRSAAVSALVAAGGTLLVLPFESLRSYLELMNKLGDTFAGGSYNLPGLLFQSQLGSVHTGLTLSIAGGLAILAVAYRRRSLPLCVAASLVLSPIVWLHYLLLLVVPIALARPRLSPLWAFPLAFWYCPGNGAYVHWRHVLAAMIVMAAITLVSERRPRQVPRSSSPRLSLAPQRS